jgi:hypothetical protein
LEKVLLLKETEMRRLLTIKVQLGLEQVQKQRLLLEQIAQLVQLQLLEGQLKLLMQLLMELLLVQMKVNKLMQVLIHWLLDL